ncbi:unnamed protein product [Rotaria sp. Silwood2]|nr:unnamed protein product [Rotaria sp. Silwood2]CAF3073104.1 unnamed protein product [Rotaria sp. Silwood2]CAF3309298.1 unnamed protein product [Rotaria sp. Silwood2]CAF4383521.1 unnamed protein product [Rotaria sp. Silwood2]CAF4520309.1 unnamed protein product [Rotaria sp. Silwood2]
MDDKLVTTSGCSNTELGDADSGKLLKRTHCGRRRQQLADLEKKINICRERIEQQQLEINQLKEHIGKLRAVPGKICDELDWVARGFGAIQNRLGEIHEEGPDGGLRYRGL